MRWNQPEITLFIFQVEFERVRSADEEVTTETLSKTVKRVLFGRMQSYPQKKVMTFNKHMKDFSFDVAYGDLSFLSELELKYIPLFFFRFAFQQKVKSLEWSIFYPKLFFSKWRVFFEIQDREVFFFSRLQMLFAIKHSIIFKSFFYLY